MPRPGRACPDWTRIASCTRTLVAGVAPSAAVRSCSAWDDAAQLPALDVPPVAGAESRPPAVAGVADHSWRAVSSDLRSSIVACARDVEATLGGESSESVESCGGAFPSTGVVAQVDEAVDDVPHPRDVVAERGEPARLGQEPLRGVAHALCSAV